MSDIPAFPTQFFNADKQAWIFDKGMTLRDYFAAKAMQGMMSDPNIDMHSSEVAKLSYQMANAMMKARKYE
jgi:hypothetical protein